MSLDLQLPVQMEARTQGKANLLRIESSGQMPTFREDKQANGENDLMDRRTPLCSHSQVSTSTLCSTAISCTDPLPSEFRGAKTFPPHSQYW